MSKKHKASVLAYTLVIMSIISILLVSVIQFIAAQIKNGYYTQAREQAFHIAEAGISYYRWYLAHETDGENNQQLLNFWQSGNALGLSPNPFQQEYVNSEGESLGKYSVTATPFPLGSTMVTVESTGWTHKYPNIKRTIKVRLRRASWSEYILLSDEFLHFADGTEVFGRIHSNNGVRMDGVAHNIVSSLLPSINDPTHGGGGLEFGVHTHSGTTDPLAPEYPWPDGTVPERDDVFRAGRDFPAPEVVFSGVTSDFPFMKSEAQGPNGDYYDATGAGRRIILKNDGTYDICTVDQYHHTSFGITRYLRNSGTNTCNSCSGLCLSNHPIPSGGVIFVENNIWVEGSINGANITIAAANLSGGAEADIFIGMDNIRYASYDCNNIIGLVAQRNISVIRDCPDNFVVDAALLSQSGRVGRGDHSFSNKSSITFNGAIASYLQPYFNHGNNGFGIRTYNFDNNLLYCPPPYFPTGTEYRMDLWEEI